MIKTDISITTKSHAKINWLLSVGPIRTDKYHELLTLFQALDIGDEMSFAATGHRECLLSGYPASIPVHTNLVYRAWELLRVNFPGKVGGVDIAITKQLPAGGGLGGGSSNAACTLQALNQLFELGLTAGQLKGLGASLGSDVPFFIRGGCALARGRGELLELVTPAPQYHLVLIFPEEPMSTAEAYRELDSLPAGRRATPDLPQFLAAFQSGDVSRLIKSMHNDFELVADSFAWFQRSRLLLTGAGARATLLCGSGSTVAGIVNSREEAEQIAEITGGYAASTLPGV